MIEQTDLIAQETEAQLALGAVRATIAALSPAHPAAAPLAEALRLAERHRDDCRAAIVAARASAPPSDNHPSDYWAARWRT